MERLVRAGCSMGNIRAEEASGAKDDRGGLLELLDLVVEGDTLVVTAVVVTHTDFDGLAWMMDPEKPQYLDGIVVGGKVFQPTKHSSLVADSEKYDRNVRFFGQSGRDSLGAASVAVVGVGGLGTHVVQQLALLGVGRLVLIDSEEVDETNRNRYVGLRMRVCPTVPMCCAI